MKLGNGELRTVNEVKSARLGYNKMLLAAAGYLLEHKKRNILTFSPTDTDAESFIKTHMETMVRGLPVVLELVPCHGMKHRDNTLSAKRFAHHCRGFLLFKDFVSHFTLAFLRSAQRCWILHLYLPLVAIDQCTVCKMPTKLIEPETTLQNVDSHIRPQHVTLVKSAKQAGRATASSVNLRAKRGAITPGAIHSAFERLHVLKIYALDYSCTDTPVGSG